MSFVLDTNSFTKFMEHFCEFEPLLSWFNNDPAIKLVIGGSKYNDEIRKCNKFLGLVIELKRKRKVFEANKEEVDLLADTDIHTRQHDFLSSLIYSFLGLSH